MVFILVLIYLAACIPFLPVFSNSLSFQPNNMLNSLITLKKKKKKILDIISLASVLLQLIAFPTFHIS